MSSDVYRRIQRHPKFQELVQRRSSFSWLLSVTVLGLFYGFILLVAFNPGLMAMRLGGENSVITFGPVAILSMFVLFWALTAVYVRRANGEFDDLTRELIEDATQGGRK